MKTAIACPASPEPHSNNHKSLAAYGRYASRNGRSLPPWPKRQAEIPKLRPVGFWQHLIVWIVTRLV